MLKDEAVGRQEERMAAAGGGPALPDGLAPVGPEPAPQPGEILALVVARNEELRLPAGLRHLRRLGVDRVILVDNLSTDATARIAAADPRVHLFTAPGSYAASAYGIAWTNALLDRYARGHWVLTVDVDGLLVFPGSDRGAGLRALCAHLDSIGSEAMRSFLLDCFPAGPLHALGYTPDQELTEAAPCFEVPELYTKPSPDFPYGFEYGGIRERLFFPEANPRRPARWLHQKAYNLAWRLPRLREAAWFRALAPRRSPTLTNVPLVRWREGARYIAATHSMAPMRMAPSQPSGVLLHYKFLQDFHARAVDAVARRIHYDGSREYRRYLAALERDPEFSLHGPRSLRYAGPDQLVSLDLMRDTPEWRRAREAAVAESTAAP
jgi:hypothetical protein